VEQELLTLLEHMGSFPVLSGVRVAQSIVFCVLFNHQPLFVLLFFFSDCSLSFFDLLFLVPH